MVMEITKSYLTINKFSRPGTKMQKIRGLVLHGTGNPGTGALANRNYFESLKNQDEEKLSKEKKSPVFASAHEIIGLKGIIELCIPSEEIAYHVGGSKYTPTGKGIGSYPNAFLYGVEYCYVDLDGRPSDVVRGAIVERFAYLIKTYELLPQAIYTHCDITGKKCPQYYIENPSEWKKLKEDIIDLYNKIIRE